MAIYDQYGDVVRAAKTESYCDLTDPLLATSWSRELAREVTKPSILFDGPAIVDEYGRPVTSILEGSRIGVFIGDRLSGCPIICEDS